MSKQAGEKKPRIAVLGAGNWGSTVAHMIGANGYPVSLWCRSEKQREEINTHHTNTRYLEDTRLSQNITATNDLKEAIVGVPLIFVVIPSKSFREVVRSMGEVLRPSQFVIHATKGIEAETHLRMSEVLLQETCALQFGVLSGPNIALEMCQGKPAGTVIASDFPRVIEAGRRALVSEQLRVYANSDVVGVELGGTLKNVVAIAAGMLSALDLGENAKALLITRGLSEIARIGVALGADPMTFAGLAGIGDLMVTCSSPLSRNHRVGAALAKGMKLEEAVEKLGMVAEGVNTARVVHSLAAHYRLDVPLLEAVYRSLHESLSPAEGIRELMQLSSRHDIDQALQGH